MKNPELFEIYLGQEATSKKEVYEFLASTINREKQKEILEMLEEREKLGGLQIAPEIIFPHFVADFITSSRITLIRLKAPIKQWSQKIGQVKLIIILSIKKEESLEGREEVKAFVQKLANPIFLEQLLEIPTEKDLLQLVTQEN